LAASSQAKPLYRQVDPPSNYESFVRRIGPNGSGVFISRDRATFLSVGEKNALSLPDWLRLTFHQDLDRGAWAAQAEFPGADRFFFTYRDSGQSKIFRAPNAPELPQPTSTLRGNLITYDFESRELGETRGVTVYLPPGVRAENAVYMADGQSCEEFAKLLEPQILEGRIAPVAIVGVFHGPYKGGSSSYEIDKDFRAREYLKVADPDRFESYVRFLTKEVAPWAERRFGFLPNAQNRALFGFSNGGAFVMDAGAETSGTFANVLAFSIAAFDRDDLRKITSSKRLPAYWLCTGRLETFSKNTEEAAAILRHAKAFVRLDEYVSGHDTAMWGLGLIEDLRKIFPGERPR
jgi:enterochelin esterase-like enzyme